MKPRLLLVDDDAAFVTACRSDLAEAFELEQAADPRTALARLAAAPFQAVLLAVEVAGNQGYQLCASIRKQESLSEVRVALISARATDDEFARHRTLRGRADVYLRKPIGASGLRQGLATMLEQPPAARPSAASQVPFWKRWFQ